MAYGGSRMKKNMMGRRRPSAKYGGKKSEVPMGSGKGRTGLDDTSTPNMDFGKAGAKVVTGKAKSMC